MTILNVASTVLDLVGVSTKALVDVDTARLAPHFVEGVKLAYTNQNVQADGIITALISPPASRDFWVSFYEYTNNYSYSNSYWAHYRYAIVNGATGTPIFGIYTATNSGSYYYYLNGVATTTLMTLATNTLVRWDIHLDLSASGTITVYHDGTQVAQFTGDFSAYTLPDRLQFRTEGGQNTTNSTFSAVICSDSDTRNIVAVQQKPDANGSLFEWTGSFDDIDNTGYSSSYIEAATGGLDADLEFPDLPAGVSGYTPLAVCMKAQAASVAYSARGIVVSGGQEYDEGYIISSNSVMPGFAKAIIMSTDPDTGAAWDIAGINAATLTLRSHLEIWRLLEYMSFDAVGTSDTSMTVNVDVALPVTTDTLRFVLEPSGGGSSTVDVAYTGIGSYSVAIPDLSASYKVTVKLMSGGLETTAFLDNYLTITRS